MTLFPAFHLIIISNGGRIMKYTITHINKHSFFGVMLFLFLTLQLGACSSIQVGRDFDVQLFNSMVKTHVSTKAQVKSWLGNPSSTGVSMDKDGEVSEEWMYYYGAGKVASKEAATLKILQIRFDKNGLVNSYNWSNSK